MKETFTKEQQIEICNAINAAIMNGKTVMAGDIIIAGAFPNVRGVCAVRHYDWDDNWSVPILWIDRQIIQAFSKDKDDDVTVLYEPPDSVAYAPTAAQPPKLYSALFKTDEEMKEWIANTDCSLRVIIGGRRFWITTSNEKSELMNYDWIDSPLGNETERQMWIGISGKFHEMVKNSPPVPDQMTQEGKNHQDCRNETDRPDKDTTPPTKPNQPARFGFWKAFLKKIMTFRSEPRKDGTMQFITLTNSDPFKGIVHVRTDRISEFYRVAPDHTPNSEPYTVVNVDGCEHAVTETIEEIYGLLGIPMASPIKGSSDCQCRSADHPTGQESSS